MYLTKFVNKYEDIEFSEEFLTETQCIIDSYGESPVVTDESDIPVLLDENPTENGTQANKIGKNAMLIFVLVLSFVAGGGFLVYLFMNVKPKIVAKIFKKSKNDKDHINFEEDTIN